MLLRRAGPDDSAGICALLASANAANPKADLRFMRWQYWSNPYGAAVSCVAEDDGRIVSHVARIAVPMLVHGRRVSGALTVDAATMDAYRARGIYTQLRDHSALACREHGFLVALDFRAPGGKLPRGGAQHVASYRRHVIPLDAGWLAERMRVPVALTKPLVRAARPGRAAPGEEVEATPDDLDTLWQDVEPLVQHGVRKEGTWWRWRYDARPSSAYRYFVFREAGNLAAVAVAMAREGAGGRVVAVLDLFARSPDAARGVVRTIAGDARGAGAIAFLAPSGTVWSRVAREAGFRLLPRWADRKRPSLHARDFSGDHPEFMTLRWVSTWGDMDHV